MMSVQARHEYAREVSARYRAASRKEKGRILDEFTRTCGYNRKYAVSLLRQPPARRTTPVKRPRAVLYDEPVRRALAALWELTSGLCSKRLVPFLPELLQALERHGEWPGGWSEHKQLQEKIRSKLLTLSPATADRLLAPVRRTNPARGRSTTKPGTLLREQVKVRTSFGWDENRPGYFEADLVAHCAESGAGEFLYTLTLTDIATGWTECEALLNRSEKAVVEAIERIRKRLPFPLLGIDSDNGSEFINHLLKKYCDQHSIEFTRSRPYRKNDQAHVEQKNWTVVRQFIGYARFEGASEHRMLQKVHSWLRLYVNFFQPSLKLKSKAHDQETGKTKKSYQAAATPYCRLMELNALDEHEAKELKQMYEGLNPCQLKRQLDQAILCLQQAPKVTSTESQNLP